MQFAIGYPESEIEPFKQAVRRDHYDLSIFTEGEKLALSEIHKPAGAGVMS